MLGVVNHSQMQVADGNENTRGPITSACHSCGAVFQSLASTRPTHSDGLAYLRTTFADCEALRRLTRA
jgi:hypothetical protein